ncbi:MAG TPA: carboxypeptidase-like regulatory domain-containing protein [Blastocatellia bacterium]|nr:carboxypeptidase-like regulatory domain-containing protein [Blastocatellia bacterium]
MKLTVKLTAVAALVSLMAAGASDVQAAALGSIRGLVKDGSGDPLAGAAIVVVTGAEGGRSEKIVKRASTDNDGKFAATNLVPGRYRVKAVADGFSPVVLPADVMPNKATVFDSILLRRVGTLDQETSLDLDPKYASRTAAGTIFHYEQGSVAAGEQVTQQLAEPVSVTHGFVHMFSEVSPGVSGVPGSLEEADFALSQELGKAASLAIRGQAGLGQFAPQRLEAFTTTVAGERHRVAMAIGYGRFTILREGDPSRLGQLSVSATDTWQVSGPVLILYGLQFDKFTEGGYGSSLLPRLGVAVDTTSRTRLFAGLVPGPSVDAESAASTESGEVVFPGQRLVSLDSANQPVPDRSFRVQVGGDQALSDNSSIEVMAFFDTISGHPVGLMAVPADGTEEGANVRADQQSGQSRGFRVVYHRRMGKIVDGAVGYAFGEGQSLNDNAITNPASLFCNRLFQVVSAKIDADFVRSGTRVSAVMRFAPGRAVFAIDPFQGQFTTYDPNVSILLTQELPGLGFLPGQWTAIVDLRNLLNQQISIAEDRQELVASRFHRLIRIGVALRF